MKQPAAAAVHSALEIPMDHPSFAGHFPKFPVLPGAVLLDETLHAIQAARGIDLRKWRIESVKFQGAVLPGDAMRLQHTANDELIRFAIHCAGRLVASGSLSSIARRIGPFADGDV